MAHFCRIPFRQSAYPQPKSMQSVAKAIADLKTEFERLPVSVGALFFGSAQRGENTAWSDLDLYVLHNGEEKWSEGRRARGYLVELSFSPIRCMRQHLVSNNAAVTHAFATRSILLDRTGEVASLVEEARRRWVDGPPPADSADRLRWQFRLTDSIFDLRDLAADDPDTRAIASVLVQQAIEAACACAGRWLPPRKANDSRAAARRSDPRSVRR